VFANKFQTKRYVLTSFIIKHQYHQQGYHSNEQFGAIIRGHIDMPAKRCSKSQTTKGRKVSLLQ